MAYEKDVIKRLEAMTLDDAKKAILNGRFGDIGSSNHQVASSWLAAKQAIERDFREEETLSIAKEANRIASNALAETRSEVRFARRSRWIDRTIATTAIIIAAIVARDDIKSLISWLLKSISKILA